MKTFMSVLAQTAPHIPRLLIIKRKGLVRTRFFPRGNENPGCTFQWSPIFYDTGSFPRA